MFCSPDCFLFDLWPLLFVRTTYACRYRRRDGEAKSAGGEQSVFYANVCRARVKGQRTPLAYFDLAFDPRSAPLKHTAGKRKWSGRERERATDSHPSVSNPPSHLLPRPGSIEHIYEFPARKMHYSDGETRKSDREPLQFLCRSTTSAHAVEVVSNRAATKRHSQQVAIMFPYISPAERIFVAR